MDIKEDDRVIYHMFKLRKTCSQLQEKWKTETKGSVKFLEMNYSYHTSEIEQIFK